MVLIGNYSQPYSQYPVWTRAYMRSRLSLVSYGFLYPEAKQDRLLQTTNPSYDLEYNLYVSEGASLKQNEPDWRTKGSKDIKLTNQVK